MDVKQLYTIFRNHTHTGAYPDAKKLPPWALGLQANIGFGLISPNNSRFVLGVDDDGVPTTTAYPYALLVVSPDGSTFALGVDSDGAVTCGPAATTFKSIIFARSYPMIDSLGNPWNLTVANDGVLCTEPA